MSNKELAVKLTVAMIENSSIEVPESYIEEFLSKMHNILNNLSK